MSNPVTYSDVETKFVLQAARSVASRYWRYGVTTEDLKQEIYLWLYSERGQKNVARWLANDPQQTSRIRHTFIDTARRYAEQEKALKVGYDYEDIHWYTLNQVVGLLPLALDDTFDGALTIDQDRTVDVNAGIRSKKNPAEGNDLLVMVLDVRRAIKAVGNDPTAIVNYLGGAKPKLGDRKVTTNAAALARTGSEYDG